MDLFSFSLSLIFALLTLTVATTMPNSKVIQRQTYPAVNGSILVTTATTTNFIGECIPVKNPHLETNITIMGPEPPGAKLSYIMLGFPTDCYHGIPTSLPTAVEYFTSSVAVNPRHPICSFKIGNYTGSNVDVIFTGQDFGESTPTYKRTVTDDSCYDLCASSSSSSSSFPSWDRYVQSVEIRGKNNYINIFSDSECSREKELLSPEVKVGRGANLANLTLKHPTRFMKYFIIDSANVYNDPF